MSGITHPELCSDGINMESRSKALLPNQPISRDINSF